MNEEELKILEQVKEHAIPHIKKLGHKPGEWKLGDRPQVLLCLETECESCKKKLRCQRCLKIENKKVINGWEIIAGDHVIGELVGNDIHKFKGHEKNYCSRFMNLI